MFEGETDGQRNGFAELQRSGIEKIAAFRSHMGDSVLEHAEDWEAVVEKP